MMNASELHVWRRQSYFITLEPPGGRAQVDGIALAEVPLGLHFRSGDWIDVTHIPSGRRVTQFATLGAAMECALRIAYMTDWTRMEPEIPATIHTIVASVRESMV